MKLQLVSEAKYTSGIRPALEFLQGAIKNEEDFLEDDDDDGGELIEVYQWAMGLVKAGELKSTDDLSQIGDAVYIATGSGDTDLSDHVQTELGRLLGIS